MEARAVSEAAHETKQANSRQDYIKYISLHIYY